MTTIKTYALLIALFITSWNGATYASGVMQAAELIAKPVQKTEEDFDIAKAQKQFYDISLKLSTSERSYDTYVAAVTQLESLKVKAQICLEEAQISLLEVDAQLDTQMALQKESASASSQYLREKREALLERASDCHLFMVRVDEAIPIYKKSIQEMGRSQMLARATPVWDFSLDLIQELRDVSQLAVQFISAHIKQLAPWSIELMTMLLLALTLGFGLSRRCAKLLPTLSKKNHFTYSFMATLGKSPLSFGIIVLGVFIVGLSLALGMPPYLKDAGAVLLLLALYTVFLKMLFVPTAKQPAFVQVDPHLGRVLFGKGLIHAIVLTFGAIGIGIAEVTELPTQVHDFVHMVCMLTIVLASTWFAGALIHLKAVQIRPPLDSVLKGCLILLTLTLVFLEVIGYQILAVYILKSLFASAVTLVLFTIAFYFFSNLLRSLLAVRFFTSKPLKHYLGIKAGVVFWEGILLLYLCYALLLYALTLTILLSWQLPYFLVFELTSGAIYGFTFADITLVPLKLVIAVFLFALFNIAGRFVSTYVLHQVQKTHEMRTQTALGSIIRYISFVIALFLALFIVQVDLSGIALIIGALSVGIGLGLRDIVNNFISGVILLVEKPIKQGDQITVEDVQGYVKKIGLRSTCIATDEQTDIIVPNANIISNPVTNFMFAHKYWCVKCTVNVAHGNDPDKIQRILLDLAKQHPQVIQNPPNQPKVNLLSLEDKQMKFELRCIIRDASKNQDVTSDLNFAIEKAFREQKIQV
ncbi:MAG: mechanosensitive ion channel domain-containing protein [Pseudomonadota bacterium]